MTTRSVILNRHGAGLASVTLFDGFSSLGQWYFPTVEAVERYITEHVLPAYPDAVVSGP